MIAPPCLMPERNPVAFVAVGSVPIHAPDPVNELAVTRIVRGLAGRRSKSNGGSVIRTTSLRALDSGSRERRPNAGTATVAATVEPTSLGHRAIPVRGPRH